MGKQAEKNKRLIQNKITIHWVSISINNGKIGKWIGVNLKQN